MRKKLDHQNPIRHLRACLCQTQAMFAKRFDLTPRQLQVMELGQAEVSDSLARRWFIEFGVDPSCMKRPRGFATMAVGGKRATGSIIESWKDIQRVDEEDRARATTQALSQLKAILKASPDAVFPVVLEALGVAFESVIAEHKLKDEISEQLDALSSEAIPTPMTVGEISKAFPRSPEWRKVAALYSPAERAIVRQKRTPLWATLDVGMKSAHRDVYTVEVRKRRHQFQALHWEERRFALANPEESPKKRQRPSV